MQKSVYYWSPFLSKIATIDAVINSAYSLTRYSKKYNCSIINAIGEFNSYSSELLNKKINLINLNNLDLYKYLPNKGILGSRLSFIIIFIISFVKLKKLLKENKPDYLIIHLITSLPLFLNFIFNFKTKIILRISGYPKLNFIRKFFWRILLKKVYKITCPTNQTKEFIIKENLAVNKKIDVLHDPIIIVKKINKMRKDKNIEYFGKYIFAAGRLTKQKNFKFLIKSFREISSKFNSLNLVIAGEGEEEYYLKKIVKKYKIQNKVFFIGHQNNIYKFFNNCECFVLTSLWEDPGFVIIEAAFCRANIISSNCLNGPKDFFDDKRIGYVFDVNNNIEFIKLLEVVLNDRELKNYKNKKILFRRTKDYTIFKHFQKLNYFLSS
jgi:glycosyltransferase involved in cell wall biosynthesis